MSEIDSQAADMLRDLDVIESFVVEQKNMVSIEHPSPPPTTTPAAAGGEEVGDVVRSHSPPGTVDASFVESLQAETEELLVRSHVLRSENDALLKEVNSLRDELHRCEAEIGALQLRQNERQEEEEKQGHGHPAASVTAASDSTSAHILSKALEEALNKEDLEKFRKWLHGQTSSTSGSHGAHIHIEEKSMGGMFSFRFLSQKSAPSLPRCATAAVKSSVGGVVGHRTTTAAGASSSPGSSAMAARTNQRAVTPSRVMQTVTSAAIRPRASTPNRGAGLSRPSSGSVTNAAPRASSPSVSSTAATSAPASKPTASTGSSQPVLARVVSKSPIGARRVTPVRSTTPVNVRKTSGPPGVAERSGSPGGLGRVAASPASNGVLNGGVSVLHKYVSSAFATKKTHTTGKTAAPLHSSATESTAPPPPEAAVVAPPS